LFEPILEIGGIEVWPYFLGDSVYSSYLYLLKIFKASITDLMFNDKKMFDESLNLGRLSLNMHLNHLKYIEYS
jgi:hypothetical protein